MDGSSGGVKYRAPNTLLIMQKSDFSLWGELVIKRFQIMWGLSTLWGFMSVKSSRIFIRFKEAKISYVRNLLSVAELFPHTLAAVEPFSIAWPAQDGTTSHTALSFPVLFYPNTTWQWSSLDSHFPISHLKQRGTGHASTFVIQVFLGALNNI